MSRVLFYTFRNPFQLLQNSPIQLGILLEFHAQQNDNVMLLVTYCRGELLQKFEMWGKMCDFLGTSNLLELIEENLKNVVRQGNIKNLTNRTDTSEIDQYSPRANFM
jgi:hypothetical protein